MWDSVIRNDFVYDHLDFQTLPLIPLREWAEKSRHEEQGKRATLHETANSKANETEEEERRMYMEETVITVSNHQDQSTKQEKKTDRIKSKRTAMKAKRTKKGRRQQAMSASLDSFSLTLINFDLSVCL